MGIRTEELASKVYELLIEYAGADASKKKIFVYYQTHPPGRDREWRLTIKLGSTGKFVSNESELKVTADDDDLTSERRELIQKLNTQLACLCQEEICKDGTASKD
ncbi:MAG: hypothetical protein KW793_03010 [Candidatus Doudnabacteria bacterium]|nr:hypothetical protein [Candidatus Doudnabacteria bacterium]